MSHSFFLGTDAQVYHGSRSFSAKINAAWADYGLLESQALGYAELDAIYAAAYVAAVAPATRTRGKVMAKRDAKAKLKIMASDLAKIIAGQSHVANEQKIALGLSVRGPRTPVGAPGTPHQFSVNLSEIGWLELRWKCGHPAGASGTTYQVCRRVAGESAFAFLGVVGRRRFVDQTVPAGSSSIVYQIHAMRSTGVGAKAEFNVNFGVSAKQIASGDAGVSAPRRIAA